MMMRVALCLTITMLSATAMANGAMGIGMEMWPLPIWGAYCVAMVIVEAIFIGRKLGLSWWHSFGISFGVNFVTAWLCAVGGCAAVFLHSSFVGSQINPNPFWNAVVLLLILAIPSALGEGAIWSAVMRKRGDNREWRVVGRSFAIHLLSVPLGLAILLIPDRPYLVTEGFARARRHMVIRRLVKPLERQIADTGGLPQGSNPFEWARSLSEVELGPDDWVAFYSPVYHRFDTSEQRRVPLELNRAVLGKRMVNKNDEWIVRPTWILREPPDSWPYGYGIVMSEQPGVFEVTTDKSRLGG